MEPAGARCSVRADRLYRNLLPAGQGEEEPGTGLGATYESGLIQQLLYNSGGLNTKFLPAVFTEEDRAHIPLELQRYAHFLISGDGYEELYRLLTGQPKTEKPVSAASVRFHPDRQNPTSAILYGTCPRGTPGSPDASPTSRPSTKS